MDEYLEYIQKFPAVLRNALEKEVCRLPATIEFEYEPTKVFRGVVIDEEKKKIDKTDFRSQIERGTTEDVSALENYSCSVFRNVNELKNALHLPRKRNRKRIAEGDTISEYGARICSDSTSHIDWFLYEDADPSDKFIVLEEEVNG